MSSANAITVRVKRGGVVEREHQLVAAIVKDGEVIGQCGDTDRPMLPRSAFKPFQALAVIKNGAAAAYDLGDHQLALAMASHSGEPRHVKGIEQWLADIGLDESDLRCGTHPPIWPKAAQDLYKAGETPNQMHHMCSGKHTAMLTLAKHLDVSLDYTGYDHPVQAAIRDVANEFFDTDLNDADWVIDGCCVPNYPSTTDEFAKAFGRLLSPSDDFASASDALLKAWGARPDLVAGSDQFDTALMLATDSAVLSKRGADGIQAALIKDQSMAICVKALDGAQEAAEQAMASLLSLYNVIDLDNKELAKHWAGAPRIIKNAHGDEVGTISVELPSI